MKYTSRYPGVRPFEKEEKDIFFGRTYDTQFLYDLVRVEKTVLLYSKSGLGKSSIINAGLIPKLDNINYNYFSIRLGAYSENNSISPKEKIIESLQKKTSTILQNNFPEIYENTIGFWLKSIQFTDPDKSNILIFDQFEELFTYPEEQINEVKKELGELVYMNTSSHIREKILKLYENKPDALTEEQLISLCSAVKICLLFAVRSDSLSKLNRLADYLPNLQRIFFELKPLDTNDAISAITKPASRNGDFPCPKFEFSDEAINKILSALSDNYKQPIETFQLQIVCQYAENIVLKNPEHRIIVPDDLGDIKDIHQSFYNNLIAELKTENDDEKLKLRILLEEQFIYEAEQRRLQVLEGIILKKISKNTLLALEKTHLIRSEPYQDSFTYELSHDTLVEPILKSYRSRKEEEEKVAIELQRQLELQKAQEEAETERMKRMKERSRQRKIIVIVSIAAVISLFFAGFGLWKGKVANDRLKEVKKAQEESKKSNYEKFISEGNRLKGEGNYDEAIRNYNNAKDFSSDTVNLDILIKECNQKADLKSKFDQSVNEGDSLCNNEDTYYLAMQKYAAALKLDLDSIKVTSKIAELNSKIEIAVREIKTSAKILIAAGGCEEALQQLLKAQQMKPGDSDIQQIINKCK